LFKENNIRGLKAHLLNIELGMYVVVDGVFDNVNESKVDMFQVSSETFSMSFSLFGHCYSCSLVRVVDDVVFVKQFVSTRASKI